jgi:hypothetical protein
MGTQRFAEEDAQDLAAQIKRYWWHNGFFDVKTEIIEAVHPRGREGMIYGVRSNLINGLPQGRGRQ